MCTYTHVHTPTDLQSGARPIAESDVPFSHHTPDTQDGFFPSLPGPCQFPAALANSDGDAGADCVWVHWPEG